MNENFLSGRVFDYVDCVAAYYPFLFAMKAQKLQ